MTPTIINAMRAGAFGIMSVMGSPMTFTLLDGRILRVNAVFRPKSEKLAMGPDGVGLVTKVPSLSIQRSSILACGIQDRDIEKVMNGATFVAEGRAYQVKNGEDDETMFYKAEPVLIASGETQPSGHKYVSPYAPK